MASKKNTPAVSFEFIMALKKPDFKAYVSKTPEGREWLRSAVKETEERVVYPRKKVWEEHHIVKKKNPETGKMEATGEVIGKYVYKADKTAAPKERKVIPITFFSLKLKYCHEVLKIEAKEVENKKKSLADEMLEGLE